jgi:hypothetical protein
MTRLLILSALLATACNHDKDAGGHGHAHGPQGEHLEPVEPETLAITRWTAAYELFVELPTPAPGKPVAYHAHVTRLADFAAVAEGTFRVRFKTESGVAAEVTQEGVKRPGIFVFESPAPAAGTYSLEMSYEHEGRTDAFDCGRSRSPTIPPTRPRTRAARSPSSRSRSGRSRSAPPGPTSGRWPGSWRSQPRWKLRAATSSSSAPPPAGASSTTPSSRSPRASA